MQLKSNQITDLDSWFDFAPPMGGKKQWDEDAQIVHHLVLSVEVFKAQRAQGVLEITLLLGNLLFTNIKIFFHLFRT